MKSKTTKILAIVLALVTMLTGGNFINFGSAQGIFGPAKVYAAAETTMWTKVIQAEIHERPNKSSDVVKVMCQGQTVTKVSAVNDSGWMKVRYDKNKYGYAKRTQFSNKKVLVPKLVRNTKKYYKELLAAAKHRGWAIDGYGEYYGPCENDIVEANSGFYFSNSHYNGYIVVHGLSNDGSTTAYMDIEIYKGKSSTRKDGTVMRTDPKFIKELLDKYAD